MRCPHCRTPKATTPRCAVCGGEVGQAPAVADERLRDLEVTRASPAFAHAERLQDLETNEEILGDTRIPDEAETPAVPARCRRCGTEPGPGLFCERCGFALRPAGRLSASDAAPPLLCLACGNKNPQGRSSCLSCGHKLS